MTIDNFLYYVRSLGFSEDTTKEYGVSRFFRLGQFSIQIIGRSDKFGAFNYIKPLYNSYDVRLGFDLRPIKSFDELVNKLDKFVYMERNKVDRNYLLYYKFRFELVNIEKRDSKINKILDGDNLC